MLKPHIICHMCATLDGKILTKRWPKLSGGFDPSSLFESTADSLDIPAWLVGTTTMKEFAGRPVSLKRAPRSISRTDHIADPVAKRFAIGTDAKGVLRFQKSEVTGDHTVILTTTSVSDAYLAHLQGAGVSYLVCGRTRVDLPTALRKLHFLFKINKLLLEGGGTFNGSMLRAGLVDELSLVLLPIADAGGPAVTSLFDLSPSAPTPKRAAARLRLASLKRLPHDVLWLRYRVVSR